LNKEICNIFNKIITENVPSLERVLPHSGTGSLQNTKQTSTIESPHSILSLKQAQGTEKEYLSL
jgi:hypothetical protein